MKKPKIKAKNLVLISLALAFAFSILLLSVVSSRAVTGSEELEEASPAAESETVMPEKKGVDYLLAYPGILPDHFLYPIKMIRDRIWLFLATDPVKKAETQLLFADKRLGAGLMLIEKGKEEQGLTTLTKAEKYLEQAVNQEKKAREAGKDTVAFLEKLSLASQKHEEVLLNLQEVVSDSGKATVNQILAYPRQAFEAAQQALGL